MSDGQAWRSGQWDVCRFFLGCKDERGPPGCMAREVQATDREARIARAAARAQRAMRSWSGQQGDS
ncbi:hypothetical protein D9X30_5150 [Cupriavidus sp. U2]|nr:hypothetical protein D9X30_5150 [Cupriavidus sp. U2]